MSSQMINQAFKHAKQHDILPYTIILSHYKTLNDQSSKT